MALGSGSFWWRWGVGRFGDAGEWVVLVGIVFYVASSLRRPRRDDLMLSVGLRGDFGGC